MPVCKKTNFTVKLCERYPRVQPTKRNLMVNAMDEEIGFILRFVFNLFMSANAWYIAKRWPFISHQLAKIGGANAHNLD